MKLLNIMGVVFNADNICSITKATVESEEYDTESGKYITNPAIEVVTNSDKKYFIVSEEKINETFGNIINNWSQL